MIREKLIPCSYRHLLLVAGSGQGIPAEQGLVARRISQEVGGLPLALDQAGAYIEETGRGLGEYGALYQNYAFSLQQRRGSAERDYPSSVVTTFSFSFARMRERHVAAVELLEFCAFLQPDAIPEDLLIVGAATLSPVLQATVCNPMEPDHTLEDVLTHSLIQREPSDTVLYQVAISHVAIPASFPIVVSRTEEDNLILLSIASSRQWPEE